MSNHIETIENAVNFLTANGRNDLAEAASYWQEGATANTREALENEWRVVGDWTEVWDDVLEELAAMLHRDGPVIVNYKTGEGMREATTLECYRYLETVENPEGVVDGDFYGYGFPVFLR